MKGVLLLEVCVFEIAGIAVIVMGHGDIAGIAFGAAMMLFGVFMYFCLRYRFLRYVSRLKELLESNRDTHTLENEMEGSLGTDTMMSQIYDLIRSYADKKVQASNAQILNKQTELTALQSQINPHFLYNTLESIRGEALVNDDVVVARMIKTLANFFRYSISRTGNMVRLRDEINNAKNYMDIQRYRFNNRFSMELVIEEEDMRAYDYLVPKLILQPVVENAIYHGLADKTEDGRVMIEVTTTEQELMITVSDNGVGMHLDELKKLNDQIHGDTVSLDDDKSERNTGIALPNIHRRIQILFGKKYGVEVYSSYGLGTDVEIMLPANYKGKIELDHEKTDTASQ
ncbi:MAG: sensor histidine kinase [Lachnospiraceae bacterium]|jgi:two-component system sensor histidine kinase YesM|nr:sensor histidine kinase [Lachnospiraceae bacterium]